MRHPGRAGPDPQVHLRRGRTVPVPTNALPSPRIPGRMVVMHRAPPDPVRATPRGDPDRTRSRTSPKRRRV